MATHSSILAWRIPWTEEPGRLQSIWSQRVGHDWSNLTCLWCMLPYLSVALSLSTYNKGNKWSVCPQLSVLSHHESPSSWRSWFSLYFLCTINGILFEGRDSTGWISLHNIKAMHLIFHIMKMHVKGEWRTRRKQTNENFEAWSLHGGLEEKAKFFPLGHQILLNWSNSERIREVLQNDENAHWRSIFQFSGFSEIFGMTIVFILRKSYF